MLAERERGTVATILPIKIIETNIRIVELCEANSIGIVVTQMPKYSYPRGV